MWFDIIAFCGGPARCLWVVLMPACPIAIIFAGYAAHYRRLLRPEEHLT